MPLNKLLGVACRRCINTEYGIHLVKKDCVYKMKENNHREYEICPICGHKRPLVMSLKLSGKLKKMKLI